MFLTLTLCRTRPPWWARSRRKVERLAHPPRWRKKNRWLHRGSASISLRIRRPRIWASGGDAIRPLLPNPSSMLRSTIATLRPRLLWLRQLPTALRTPLEFHHLLTALAYTITTYLVCMEDLASTNDIFLPPPSFFLRKGRKCQLAVGGGSAEPCLQSWLCSFCTSLCYHRK